MKQVANLSVQLVSVSLDDVEKMLDYYDSGMSDVSTSNAIALALRRILKPGLQVRVIRDAGGGEGVAQIGDQQMALASELVDWLETAERASPVDPISFQIALPNDWLKNPVRKGKVQGEVEPVSLVA